MRSPDAFVVSLTPFTADGDLDESGLRAHLARMRSAGIGVYLAGSGSGEGHTLTRDERARVFAIGAEELGGRVPVRAMGVEPRTATEVRVLLGDAAAAGLDAAQVYPLEMGHGYRPTADELGAYLRDAVEDAPLPLVLSTHQAVGYRYPTDLIAELLGSGAPIVGINVTDPDLVYLAHVLGIVDGRADVHVGGPLHALSALALGAQGYLCSEGNLIPHRCVELVEAHADGDLARAEAAYRDVVRVFALTQDLGGIVGAKAALRGLGAPGGHPRPPRRSPSPTDAARLADLVRALGGVG